MALPTNFTQWIAQFKLFIEALANTIRSTTRRLDEEHTVGLANIGNNSNLYTRKVSLPPMKGYTTLAGTYVDIDNLQHINYSQYVTFSVFIESTTGMISAKLKLWRTGNQIVLTGNNTIDSGESGYLYATVNLFDYLHYRLTGEVELIIETRRHSHDPSLPPTVFKYREAKLETGKTPSHWTIPREIDAKDFVGNFAPKKSLVHSIILPEHGYTYELNPTSRVLKSREGAEFTLIAALNDVDVSPSSGGSTIPSKDIIKLKQYVGGGVLKTINIIPRGEVLRIKMAKIGGVEVGLVIMRYVGQSEGFGY